MSTLTPRAPVDEGHVGLFRRHPLSSFFVLAFLFSWAGILLALILGPGGLAATPEQFQQDLPLAVPGMLLGPLVAAVVMTWKIGGREGLRELRSRATRWRVGGRWYAVALLAAPVVMGGVLLALSLFSEDFLPRIVTSSDKAPLLLMGLVTGVVVGACEELAWTGFALPRFRINHGVLVSGVLLGVLWGAWHLLQQFWASGVTSNEVPLLVWAASWLVGCLVGELTAFRVLMAWVYENTGGSVFVAMVMHASLAASTVILIPPLALGANLVSSFVIAAALWLVIAVIAASHGWHLSRRP
jgi:CAAX protease family protein